MADEDEKVVTFRADKEKVEYLDHLIQRKNVALGPGAENKISRSSLLNESIDYWIEKLEEEFEEGNPKTGPETAPMGD
jgi:hypothetical protein